jgi:RNA polymerase sigma factor (TIGR02999 family)
VPVLDEDTYAHLKNLARRIYAERGRAHQTIQPTVLLHEAWMKVERSEAEYESRAHFLACAAKAMRQILIDRARAQASAKRGNNPVRATLAGVSSGGADFDVVALDEILTQLHEIDPMAADVVTMRTFGGMTVPEAAQALGVSPRKVDRTWRFARAFLAERLG